MSIVSLACCSPPGRVYPPESCCAPNDKPVGSPDDDDEEEFEVDALLDEAQIGGTKYYLVKWKVRAAQAQAGMLKLCALLNRC